jgi:hypothetical protein
VKRRGSVRLSNEALRSLLHLRRGIKVIAAEYHPGTEEVRFFLAGPDFNEHPPKSEIRNYPLQDLMEDWR